MRRLSLPLIRGGVLIALTLLCWANVFASVRMYALWYPSLNPGQTEQVANSGATIGGQFAVRVVVQPNSGTILGASIVQQSITEQTNAHPVTPGQLAEFQGAQPNPQYGDPTQNVVVLQSPFMNLAGHNGTYLIQVTVRYYTGPIPYQQFTETASMTLTMNNLVLVDGRDDPYFIWKPDEMTGVQFSAQLLHAQNGTCTVKLERFRSDDNQNPIWVKEFGQVPRPGNWSWTWDGKLADGTIAPRGIYTYRLSAVTYVPTLPDSDSNRSGTLQITQTRLEMSEDHRLFFRYYLTEAGSDGFVLAFDPTPHEVMMWDVDVTTNAGWNSLEVILPPVEESPPGSIRYLALIHDRGHINGMDKAHRMRWALPLNSGVPLVGVIIDAGHGGPSPDSPNTIDHGAVGRYDSTELWESDINLYLANLLGSEILTKHLTTLSPCFMFPNPFFSYRRAYTRTLREDKRLNPDERKKRIARFVEQGFSTVVSIHVNSCPGQTTRRDFEVFYSPANRYGAALASPVYGWLCVLLRPELRPTKVKAAAFYVLHAHSVRNGDRVIGRQVPAVLVETGWMNNPVDLRELDPSNPEGEQRRSQTVQGIHLGLDGFYSYYGTDFWLDAFLH